MSVAALALIAAGCRTQAAPAAKEVMIWETVGSWSGHGNLQTESFPSDTGALRVRWETRNGTGAFRLTAHSAVSGRPVQTAVDQKGIGHGMSYIHDDPRVFYLVIESANVDWSFTLDEGVMGKVVPTSTRFSPRWYAGLTICGGPNHG